jgi:hypothetical protein
MSRNQKPSTTAVAADHVELWKKVVDVQMHFNDLQLRVRTLAFTVTAAFLALGGYALKDAGPLTILGAHIPLAAVVIFSAVVPVFAFYFMERWWYYPLLNGAVLEGAALEKALRDEGVSIDLGGNISRASGLQNWLIGQKIIFTQAEIDQSEDLRGRPTKNAKSGLYVKLWNPVGRLKLFTRRSFRSFHKMMVFYWLLIVSLGALGGALWFADKPPTANNDDARVHVNLKGSATATVEAR